MSYKNLHKNQNHITAISISWLEDVLKMPVKAQRGCMLIASYIKWGASDPIVEYVDIPVVDIISTMGWNVASKRMSPMVKRLYNDISKSYSKKWGNEKQLPFEYSFYDKQRKTVRFTIMKPDFFCQLSKSKKPFVRFYTEEILNFECKHSLAMLSFLIQQKVADKGKDFSVFAIKKALGLGIADYCDIRKDSTLYQNYGDEFLTDWKIADASDRSEIKIALKNEMIQKYGIESIGFLDWTFCHMQKFDYHNFQKFVLSPIMEDFSKNHHTKISIDKIEYNNKLNEYRFKITVWGEEIVSSDLCSSP